MSDLDAAIVELRKWADAVDADDEWVNAAAVEDNEWMSHPLADAVSVYSARRIADWLEIMRQSPVEAAGSDEQPSGGVECPNPLTRPFCARTKPAPACDCAERLEAEALQLLRTGWSNVSDLLDTSDAGAMVRSATWLRCGGW